MYLLGIEFEFEFVALFMNEIFVPYGYTDARILNEICFQHKFTYLINCHDEQLCPLINM